MFYEYKNILIAFCFALFLGSLLFFISYIFILRGYDLEKLSIYECGFVSFELGVRDVYDIKFYLVALLFVIFDLEIVFLFPWILMYSMLGFSCIFSMIIFLVLLSGVFIYEWILGILDW